MTFEYKIPPRSARVLPFQRATMREPGERTPRVARLVALAHKLEELIGSGRVKDYAELARLARVSPARIAQIILFRHLAPDIQEYVLFLPAESSRLVTEPELRQIAREPRWDRQRAAFERLLQSRRP